jgi:hypothetical protein
MPSGKPESSVPRAIVGYHQDPEGHWVAELECGHSQHVRHLPPWQNRPWVTTPEGRDSFLGRALPCALCSPTKQADRIDR